MKKYFFLLISFLFFVACDNANTAHSDHLSAKKDSLPIKHPAKEVKDSVQKNNFSSPNPDKREDSVVKKPVKKKKWTQKDTLKSKFPQDHAMPTLQISPIYPGGLNTALKFIADNLHYPTEALKNNISGTVYVDFTINRDGSVSSGTIRRGIGYGCDEEAIRVIKLMKGWDIGNRASCPYALPVEFKIPAK